ncbi:MAG: recombinase family protein [Bacilli bacterium]|jgi:DNA invertase Pin-like site-specific DNA recombinase|nr:recombinase family protein [Bacilli bacterium]MCH4235506.1 recombinase family protein [Bacilli bacterium]
MTYGYVRVSTITQNIDRQMDEMYKLGLEDNQIYIDKQSGKDFERVQYQILKKKLVSKDLVIIKSIDRLGRDYSMIIDEWHYITKVIEADILVIDMPLLDTRNDSNNLVGKFISDIVLQILSFVAETERKNIKQRQAEGIKLAKERGVHMGRPKIKLPDNFSKIRAAYIERLITCTEAAQSLNISRGTFMKYVALDANNHVIADQKVQNANMQCQKKNAQAQKEVGV